MERYLGERILSKIVVMKFLGCFLWDELKASIRLLVVVHLNMEVAFVIRASSEARGIGTNSTVLSILLLEHTVLVL